MKSRYNLIARKLAYTISAMRNDEENFIETGDRAYLRLADESRGDIQYWLNEFDRDSENEG